MVGRPVGWASSKIENSTRPSFGHSPRKNMVATYGSKRRKGFKSKRLTKIAKQVSQALLYFHQPNKRRNVNGDTRNDDRNKAQTHGANSKVASKEVPKASNWKKSLSSGKSYHETINTSSKSRKALTSSQFVSQGIRSVSSTRREERVKEEMTQGCRDHSWKNARQIGSEQSTRREERNEKVTQDRQIHMGENARSTSSEPSTRKEERGNKKVAHDHPKPLLKNSRPMCDEYLLRDGKDGGLRISVECIEHSTPNHVNKIKLGKRKLKGCSQRRIPNVLGREEDDVGNVESTGGRKGQMGKKHKTNVNDVSEDSRHLASNDSIVQKKRRGSEANEDGQDSRLVKDCISGVSIPTILKAIKGHCSLPINEPIWSGIFKIDSKEYVSLAGHLSTKSCKIVCMLSRSLRALVNVTKHSRLEVWPASLGASGFTDENIALFLFPPKMRPDGKLDQLVKEVIENDLALRAVMGKTEMLIFPSTMLPKQYQAFQGKHYLWGLFRPRKDIVGIVEEQAAHAMSPMENAMCVENQEASKDGTKQAEFSGVREPNMGTEPQDPEGAEMQDASDQNMAPAIGGSNASRANQPSIAATEPANREQIDSSLGIPQGRMFAFVAQPTPRFEELMQELEREGALIATMPRVTYGQGQGRSQATAKE